MRAESYERPWPGWPDSEAPGFARVFGECARDLDVNFAQRSRAELVSRLLRDCLHREAWNPDDVWSWTLAQRLQGLLAIVLAGAAAPFELTPRCEACGDTLALSIDPSLFERIETATRFTCSIDSRALEIALPTGREQQRWSHSEGVTMRNMARELVRSLDGRAPDADWEIPVAWVETLGRALEEHDPLTGLDIDSQCPACGAATSVPLDLEALLLAHLHARQRRTLVDIHRLASAYHWSEAAILDLPAWRRRHYLAQLGAAGTA
jgi:hypothetical protein